MRTHSHQETLLGERIKEKSSRKTINYEEKGTMEKQMQETLLKLRELEEQRQSLLKAIPDRESIKIALEKEITDARSLRNTLYAKHIQTIDAKINGLNAQLKLFTGVRKTGDGTRTTIHIEKLSEGQVKITRGDLTYTGIPDKKEIRHIFKALPTSTVNGIIKKLDSMTAK